MNCPKCGAANSDNSKFCTSCGSPIAVPKPVSPVQNMPQTEPSTPVQQTMPQSAPMGNGMPQGAPMQQMPQSTQMRGQIPPTPMSYIPPAQPEKKKSGAGKVILIIIVLLLLVCIGAFAAITVSKTMKEQKLQTLIGEADASLACDEYEQAIDTYKEVLDTAEKDAAVIGMTDAYIEWAMIYADAGDYEKALSILQGADSRAKQKTIKQTIASIEEMMKVHFSDADLNFISASGETVTAELNYAFIAYDAEAYLTDYADGAWEEWYEDFATARGLEVGMFMEDYIEMYDVKQNYAVWECFSGDNNEYTSFEAYSKQEPAELYEEYNNVWLDIGFCMENGEWQQLEDYEVQNVWFCDADLSDYDEVVVFAVNLDSYGQICGISVEHFTYDEGWVEWQGWID